MSFSSSWRCSFHGYGGGRERESAAIAVLPLATYDVGFSRPGFITVSGLEWRRLIKTPAGLRRRARVHGRFVGGAPVAFFPRLPESYAVPADELRAAVCWRTKPWPHRRGPDRAGDLAGIVRETGYVLVQGLTAVTTARAPGSRSGADSRFLVGLLTLAGLKPGKARQDLTHSVLPRARYGFRVP